MPVLYVPEGSPLEAVSRSYETVLRVSRRTPPRDASLVSSTLPCACGSPSGMTVRGNSVFSERGGGSWIGHPGYAFEDGTTEREFETAVLYLLRYQLNTFACRLADGGGLERPAVPAATAFRTAAAEGCAGGGCVVETLRGRPVVLLRSVVVSGKKKGPTVESVLRDGRD